MKTIQFMFDEQVPHSLAGAILRQEPLIPIWIVGKDPAPPKGTPDPDLLRFAEPREISILTLDQGTMPAHWALHLAAGNHCFGLFVIRRGFGRKQIVLDLLTIWYASEPKDWLDRVDYLPWT